MDKLYSDDPVVREAEAARYRIFHKKVNIPTKWRRYWKELLDGRTWKVDMISRSSC